MATAIPVRGAAHPPPHPKTLVSETFVGERLALVEAGRGFAACLIVAHHLTAYGPRLLAAEAAPGLVDFLYDYARMAVQVFLVFGGFSLGWMLGDLPLSWRSAGLTLAWRYFRLTVPYLAMLGLLLLGAWLTRSSSIQPPLIDSFSWPQLLAHFVYLQDVLGYDNLSAGTWYLCIDMQFTMLLLALLATLQSLSRGLWKSNVTPLVLCLVLVPLGAASAWYWNRDSRGDMLVPYFLAPLVLGVLVAWTLRKQIHWGVLLLYAGLVGASLTVDFRERLVIALVTAGVLVIGARSATVEKALRPLAPLGRISYSLFLIHYLVNWLVLSALTPLIGQQPQRALLSMGIAFFASIAAAILLYTAVERPLLRWARQFKPV